MKYATPNCTICSSALTVCCSRVGLVARAPRCCEEKPNSRRRLSLPVLSSCCGAAAAVSVSEEEEGLVSFFPDSRADDADDDGDMVVRM